MSSMFDDFKEQVRSQANIVEIVSEYEFFSPEPI